MLLKELAKDYRIILASQSARRKTLLEGLDIAFEVVVRDNISEDFPRHFNMFEIPVYLAKYKSEFYTDLINKKTIVITADTIVWHKNHLVGKPVDSDDASRILHELSGGMHEVVTGVCLRTEGRMSAFYDHSKVFFRELTSEEIDYYVAAYKPFDKAGAYAIQEWIGYIGIESIEGSFYNVMGLPVQMLNFELIKFLKT